MCGPPVVSLDARPPAQARARRRSFVASWKRRRSERSSTGCAPRTTPRAAARRAMCWPTSPRSLRSRGAARTCGWSLRVSMWRAGGVVWLLLCWCLPRGVCESGDLMARRCVCMILVQSLRQQLSGSDFRMKIFDLRFNE